MLQDAAGRTVPVQHAPARPGEQQASCIDITKSGAMLGWAPQMAITDGLKATMEFFRAAGTGASA
jgi:UDP-glucose 4-epimerase